VVAALEEARDVFEMEGAGSFEEYGFAVEAVEVELADALVGGGEEGGLEVVEEAAVALEGGADADEACDAVGAGEGGHLGVEVGLGDAGLEEVGDDECAAGVAAVVLDEVEGDGEGVEVEAVGVVDEEGVVDGFAHFEAHGHGGEAEAAAGYGVGGAAEEAEEGDAVEGVLDGGAVGKGDGDLEGLAEMAEGEGGGRGGGLGGEDLEGVGVGVAPGEAAEGAEGVELGEGGVDVFVVGAVDEGLAVGEELEFFGYFLLARDEVLVVGLADVGEDAYGGVDDAAEVFHLGGLGDAGFEDGEFVGGVDLPHGEWDADLGVVAAGAGDDAAVGGEELDDPVFDDGFAVGAGDAYDGDGELGAVVGGELLEGLDGVGDGPEVGVGAEGELGGVDGLGVGGDDEVADAALVEVEDVAAAGVALGGDGDKEGAWEVGGAAAVGEEVEDVAIGVGHAGLGVAQDGGYFVGFHCVMIL